MIARQTRAASRSLTAEHAVLVLIAALRLAIAPAQAAEIRVISPGVISNSGLTDVAAAFEKKTGVKVTIQVDGMGTIMNDTRTRRRPPMW